MTTETHASQVDTLSAANQDYIKCIWSFSEHEPTTVTTTMLAKKMRVSASTASETVKKLSELGLVLHERYGTITLTDKGTSVALGMVRRHRLIETFLVAELGYSWDKVHDEAEVLEHAVSDHFLTAINHKLGNPTHDPHGDPIPSPDGQLPTENLHLLSRLQAPASGTVVRISDSNPDILRYCDHINLTLGSTITILESHPYAGTMEIRINTSGPIHIGTPVADTLWIAVAL